MDITRQRRLLHFTTAGLLAVAGGVVAWSLSNIDQEFAAERSNRSTRPSVIDSTTSPVDASNEQITGKSLRGPLYDPPPPPPPRPEPPPKRVETPKPPSIPRLDVTLVGTIIEADKSLAIIEDASGEFDIKGIGEPLELTPQGIVVEQIDSEQVILNYQGQKSTVMLDQTSKKKTSGGSNRNMNRRRNTR